MGQKRGNKFGGHFRRTGVRWGTKIDKYLNSPTPNLYKKNYKKKLNFKRVKEIGGLFGGEESCMKKGGWI